MRGKGRAGSTMRSRAILRKNFARTLAFMTPIVTAVSAGGVPKLEDDDAFSKQGQVWDRDRAFCNSELDHVLRGRGRPNNKIEVSALLNLKKVQTLVWAHDWALAPD